MNKIAIVFLTWLAALSAAAQGNLSANQRLVGHTVTDDIDVSGAVIGEPGTYTIGATLDANVLSAYKGCRVVGIRLAAAVDLGRTRVFLNNIDGNTMSLLQSKTQRIYEGWNEVFFNGDGYTITGTENFFYGFDYVETQEMLTAEKGGIASTGNDTNGAFMIYMDDALYPVSQVGKLCVQLIVDVTNLPADNMVIGFFDTGFKYKKGGEPMEVFAMLTNTGRDAVESYTMGCRFDNGEAVYVDVTDNIMSGAQESWNHTFPLPDGLQAGSHTMAVWVEKVNSTTIGFDASKAVTVNFATYDNSIARNGAYVEVYSDQNSPYTSLLNPVLAEADSETFVVNVHAPKTALAIDESSYLFDLYAYTTPSFTVNRSYFPGEQHIAYDMNDFLAMLDHYFLTGIFLDIVAQDKTTPCFAGLELSSSFDPATRLLTVNAKGQALPEAKAIYGEMGLTLMAVEDGVTGSQAVVNALNQITTNRNYKHDNVLRGYLTAPCGSPLTIDGDSFSATYSMTLPADWDASKMKVTGILTKAADSPASITAGNARDYDIINVAATAVDSGAGIDSVTADGNAEIDGYYTLQGIRVDAEALTPGVYIRRYTDGHADKVVVR